MNAIITGATKGIGHAIAVQLAEAGYNLALCSRSLTDLEALKESFQPYGNKIFIQQVDCSVKEQVYAFCNVVKAEFQKIDVLVNNAGLFLPGLLLEEPDDHFENQLSLNLNAVYYLSKFFGKMMAGESSGHIFNICSVASKQNVENAGSYSVTKAALLSLNHVFREELSKYGVKVSAILPGSTLTASWEGTSIPRERFVQAEDIAKTIFSILNLSTGVNVDEVMLKPLQF